MDKDDEILIDAIVEANRNRQKYYMRCEQRPSLVYEGEFDLGEQCQHFYIRRSTDSLPAGEVYWANDDGIGRRLNSEAWFHITGLTIPNYLRATLALLLSHTHISIAKVGEQIVFTYAPRLSELRDDWSNIARRLFSKHPSSRESRFIDRFAENGLALTFELQIVISNTDAQIIQVVATSGCQDGRLQWIVHFGPSRTSIPQPPLGVAEKTIATIPLVMLLMDVPLGWGGWSGKGSHGVWAQRSLDLIEKIDQKESSPKYGEIYEWADARYTIDDAKPEQCTQEPFKPIHYCDPVPEIHHPLVLGACYEDNSELAKHYDAWFVSDSKFQLDYYYSQKGYKRYFNHYGGREIGLKYSWYHDFDDAPPRPKPGDRYYSARDWGYGGSRLVSEAHNRLTFTEAVRQYNQYTFEAKRRAYLMLGHVIHLLQDVGQPDHARLLDHAASGMSESEAFEKFLICETYMAFAGLNAGVLCIASGPAYPCCLTSVMQVAYLTCQALIDGDEVGYEKLIEDKLIEGVWGFHEIEDDLKAVGVTTRAHFDAFFQSLATYSDNVASSLGFGGRLGLSSIVVPGPQDTIPGLNPDIDRDDKSEYEPYLELTRKLLPRIVSESAGLIQHFFEVVNHPPIVERFAIVQWEPKRKPVQFGKLGDDLHHCTRYDAKWDVDVVGDFRTLHVAKRQHLSPDRTAYVFVLIGPSSVGSPPSTRGRVLKEISLRMRGTHPTGESIDRDIVLHLNKDNDVGHYYWGSFEPRNCSKEEYTISFFIDGRDGGAHFLERKYSGEEIDGNPGTLAQASSIYPYEWVSYSTYGDGCHKVQIQRAEWKVTVNPNLLVLSARARDKPSKGIVTVSVMQRAWDCGMEPFWVLTECPTEWELVDLLTHMGRPGKPPLTLTSDESHLHLHRERRGKELEIHIEPSWEDCLRGRYELTVVAYIGDQGKPHVEKVKCEVELL